MNIFLKSLNCDFNLYLKLQFKFFFICLAFSCIFMNQALAHQPLLNPGNISNSFTDPFIIKDPEVSKVIFSELIGKSHYYLIDSSTPFSFYLGITQPMIEGCPMNSNFSLEVLDFNNHIIDSRDGYEFEWWQWFEEYGNDWYWIGPEIGKDFMSDRVYEPGKYYIRVFNDDNIGKYGLTVGDIEKFTLPVIARTLLNMPKIESKYWNQSSC